MNQNRKNDETRTSKLDPYLDWLYQENGYNIERVYDKERQLQGKDILLTKDGVSISVDEKAAINSWNRKLKTFGLEVYSKNNPNGVGWFLNRNLKNTHYAFVYLKAKDEELNEIEKIEVYLVKKKRIKKYVKDNDVGSFSKMKHKLDREGHFYRQKKSVVLCKDIKLSKFYNKKERPMFLLIRKKVLERLCDKHLVMNKEQIQNVDKSLNKSYLLNKDSILKRAKIRGFVSKKKHKEQNRNNRRSSIDK